MSEARWAALAAAAPELAAFVHERLAAHRHRTLATLRADGSPRTSGIELAIYDGDLWLGAMPTSRKVADLRRDPRLAVQSGSDDPPAWCGDARISGRAVFVEDDAAKAAYLRAVGSSLEGPFALVRVAITEVSSVRLDATGAALDVAVWRPGGAVRRFTRA